VQIALISDIHGNLEALVSVLNQIEKLRVDEIHCLGDVVGYGCNPIECLNLIDKNAKVKLMGNHEYAILGHISTDTYTAIAKMSTEWTRNTLTDREFSIISDFKMKKSFDNILMVHASPYENDYWRYILTPEEAYRAFEDISEKICFYGHSHIPMIFTESSSGLPRRQVGHDFDPFEESRYLVNIGSVGQPRDNDPRACFVTFDTESQDIKYHRVEYDINKAQSKMTKAKLPEMLINRLAVGR